MQIVTGSGNLGRNVREIATTRSEPGTKEHAKILKSVNCAQKT